MNARRILALRRNVYRDQEWLDAGAGNHSSIGGASAAAAHVDIEQHEQYQNLKDQALRIKAEFENFRKRAQREKEDLKKFAVEDVVIKMVQILDDMDRAMESAASSDNIDSVVSGVKIIRDQFWNQLQAAGVEAIATDGQAFDPNLHDAVMTAKAGDVPDNHIVETLQPGYKLNDRVIRAAMVSVAKK